MQFKELGLSEELLSAVKSMGFDEMTEIQEKSIPVIMKGLDIIGRSNTGTGKTAAFGIPVIEKILQNDSDFIQTLILLKIKEKAIFRSLFSNHQISAWIMNHGSKKCTHHPRKRSL